MFKRPQLVNRQINREQATGVDGVVLNEVARRDKFWWHYPGLRTLNLLLLGAICCDITNGYDGSMLNGLQILPQWQEFFNHPKGGRLGLISNGTRIGQAGAIITIAPILQKFGRRKPIIFGSAFMLIGIALQTAAQNLPMFVIGRVIIGLGNNIQQSASLVLLAEIAYPPQRPAVLGIMNTTGSVGQILAAWVSNSRDVFVFANMWIANMEADYLRNRPSPRVKLELATAQPSPSLLVAVPIDHGYHDARIATLAHLQQSSRGSSQDFGQIPRRR